MKSTRERYEPWLRDYLRPRFPELEPALLAAIDAFDAIKRQNQAPAALLAPIVDAASSSRIPLYENATAFLGKLTEQFAEARDAVVKMAQDPQIQVRYNAILCLVSSTPLDLAHRLLRQGLRDKSTRVRMKAADWSGRLRLRQLVPDLEEVFTLERNVKTKQTIEFELRLLRDGYILEPGPDDGFNITTFCHNGIVGRWVRRSELEQRGLDAIVAELAKS